MIDLIVKIASTIAGLGIQMRSLKRDRRNRIADLLINIADCVADIASEFRGHSRNVSWHRCAELSEYLYHVGEIAKSEIAEDQLSDLLEYLGRARDGRVFLSGMGVLGH